jgi:NADH-quinone oxidoreductase subunit N
MVAFFTTAPKMAALVVFARILYDAFPLAVEEWRQVLLIVSMLSMAVGAFAGLVQRNLKRLLAYSSISNMGYALLAMSAGTEDGIRGLLIFMVLYMVDNLGLFACLLAASRAGRPMETIDDFAGLARVRPGLALAISALALSVAGIPPFSGFWAKYFYAFQPAIDAGLWGPGRLRPAGRRGGGLLLPAAGQDDLVRPRARPDRRLAARDARGGLCLGDLGLPVFYVVLGLLEPYATRAAQSFGF